MEIKETQLENIRDGYLATLMYIHNNDYKAAIKQLYEVLDPLDYDLSLDIMYNYNKEFKYEELRELILRVDGILTNYEKNNRDEELGDDNFINKSF